MMLASATWEGRSPATFLNWREEARHDRSPLPLLWMPEVQPVTPAKRTVPIVCRRAAGDAVPMPKLPFGRICTTSPPATSLKICRAVLSATFRVPIYQTLVPPVDHL